MYTVVVFLYFKVPLGVQLKNENIIEEMVDIMSEAQRYVPTISKLLEIEVSEGSTVTAKADHFHNVLFGGDQLTVARARGAQHVRKNSVDGVGRLDGLVPVCEDWHARVVLLSVSHFFWIPLCLLHILGVVFTISRQYGRDCTK